MGTMSVRRSVFERLGNPRICYSVKAQETQKDHEKICKYWVSGNCKYNDRCKFLHSWFDGEDFTMLKRLEGHKLALTGIALPSGSDKLYSGSRDGTMRIWDCKSGKCVNSINLGYQIGCLVSEGSWVFVGLPDLVLAWNSNSNVDIVDPFFLEGPVGQVYAITVNDKMLFAGSQDGSILVWRASCEANPFELVASLDGHTMPVVCLTVGANMLYSGSMDNTFRVWDLQTLQCIQTVKGHTDVVKSLLCWDHYLIICSLDRTIKVWRASSTEKDCVELIYTRDEESGVNSLCGSYDAEAKPILVCSCKDDSVRLYELPSFQLRGRIFSTREVGVIQSSGGLFFTGDGLGVLSVWQWLAEQTSGAS